MNNVKDQVISDHTYLAINCECVRLEVERPWGQKSFLNYKKKCGIKKPKCLSKVMEKTSEVKFEHMSGIFHNKLQLLCNIILIWLWLSIDF